MASIAWAIFSYARGLNGTPSISRKTEISRMIRAISAFVMEASRVLTVDDLAAVVTRGVGRGQYVADPFALLPTGNGGPALGFRHEPRALHEFQLVNVARAVRKDLAHPNAHDELGLGVLDHQRILV